MLHLFFLATVTFFYDIQTGVSYQACHQKTGTATPTCVALTASPQAISNLADDTEYEFWVKADGVDSPKVKIRTKKKDVMPPALVLSATCRTRPTR